MLCLGFYNFCWFYLTAQTWKKESWNSSQVNGKFLSLLLRKTDTNVNLRSQNYSQLWTWCSSVCVLLCAPFILHKAATLSDSSQSHREGQTEKMSQSSFSCLLKSGSVFHISSTRHNFKWNFMLWSTTDNTKRKRLKSKVYTSPGFQKKSPYLCVLFWVSLNTELGTSLPLKGDTGGKVRSYFPVTPFHIAFIYWIINLKLWPGKPHWGLLPAQKEE